MNGGNKVTLGKDTGYSWAEVLFREVPATNEVKAVSRAKDSAGWTSYYATRSGKWGRVNYIYEK